MQLGKTLNYSSLKNMSETNPHSNIDDSVDFKVKRRVARKVMKEIHHQVVDVEKQVELEKNMARFLLPWLLFFAFLSIGLTFFWTDLMRLLSGFIS